MSYLTSSNLISANLRNRDNSSNQESSLGFPEHIPFSSMSLSLGTKSTTLGQSNLDSLGSALNHPRKFTTYAERMSTNLAFSDGTSLSVGSPKTKKTGAETREELLNSLLSRTNTLSATEQRTLPYVNVRSPSWIYLISCLYNFPVPPSIKFRCELDLHFVSLNLGLFLEL
ncbi:unnamed protein product [Camellia sinensis]